MDAICDRTIMNAYIVYHTRLTQKVQKKLKVMIDHLPLPKNGGLEKLILQYVGMKILVI